MTAVSNFAARLNRYGRPLFFAALLLLTLALFARISIHFFSHNYNLSAEGNGLSGIVHLVHGDPLYPPLNRHPLYIYIYCPFHAYAAAAIINVLHLTGLRPEVLATRSLSLFSFILALVIFYFVVVRPRAIRLSLFMIAVALGASKFSDYVTTARNDALAILIDVVAISFALAWERKRHWSLLFGLILACALSIFTRQTGVIVLGAAVLWLLIRREWWHTLVLVGGVGLLTAGWAIIFQHLSAGQMFTHVVLANIRGFKPFDRSLVDFSITSFGLSYLMFAYLVLRGARDYWSQRWDPEILFLNLVLGVGLGLPLVALFRAGGDVNYFFDGIFVGFLFCARGLETLVEENQKFRDGVRWLMTIQFILISAVCSYKTYTAYQIAFRPYEQIANRLRQEKKTFVFATGRQSVNMNVHLWDLAFHGPDISDSGYIAQNADKIFRPLLGDLKDALHDGRIPTVVVADQDCRTYPIYLPYPFEAYGPVEKWHDWLCVYRFKPLGPFLPARKRS